MPRKKFNLEVPAEFCDEIDRIAERYGFKWLGYSAGMLLFLEASEKVQRDAVRRVQDAEWDGGDYGPLTKAAIAKSGPPGPGDGPKGPIKGVPSIPPKGRGPRTPPTPETPPEQSHGRGGGASGRGPAK